MVRLPGLKLLSALVMLWLAASCAEKPSGNSDITEPSRRSKNQERYEEVRAGLVLGGWVPVPAKCSPQNLCGEHEELSTNMETVVSCGVFKKGHQTATVCGESIPDALLVTSIEIDPKD